ncbi:MAG: hypothetical protein ABL898_11390 [Hyphomicrobiaceae bacterium]|nr:hypothetical protein [Hyphomicrobiaceae bacterium]
MPASTVGNAVADYRNGSLGKAKATGAELKAAREAARERYAAIADAIKREAGIKKHYRHKVIGGLAWTGTGKILAPEGITRRQLYVLAHECGHIVLHSTPASLAKPGHVKEHEAETYAHRAFKRYDLEVPEKSARWARLYVGQWIAKDADAGIAICAQAADFALGKRSPYEALPSVDGLPSHDFSKSLDRFVAKGSRLVAAQESEAMANEIGRIPNPQSRLSELPNACGTCLYFEQYSGGISHQAYHDCKAHGTKAVIARTSHSLCNHGVDWRPHADQVRELQKALGLSKPGFWSRVGSVLIERFSSRNRGAANQSDQNNSTQIQKPRSVVQIEDQSKRHKR